MRGNQSGLKAMEKNHPNMYGCKIWMFVWGKEFYKSLGEGGFQFTESNHSIFFLHSGSPFTMIFGSSTMVFFLCRLLQGDVQIWKNGGLKPIMMRSLSPHFSSVWLFAGAYLSSNQTKNTQQRTDDRHSWVHWKDFPLIVRQLNPYIDGPSLGGFLRVWTLVSVDQSPITL